LSIASEQSGLSEAAIKIRCNKSREGSENKKDKIHCKWVDDTTFRSYQAKKSKNKGSGWEGEIVKRLKEIGYDDVCRSAGQSRFFDNNKVDIYGDTPCCIQAKCTQNLPNYFKIREASTDERPLAIFWKKVGDINSISEGQLAVVDLDFFYELLKVYKQNGSINSKS
jgi:hypothetical protein